MFVQSALQTFTQSQHEKNHDKKEMILKFLKLEYQLALFN